MAHVTPATATRIYIKDNAPYIRLTNDFHRSTYLVKQTLKRRVFMIWGYEDERSKADFV
jgi:hypothetical protein